MVIHIATIFILVQEEEIYMNLKMKPSLFYLAIPIILFIFAVTVAAPLIIEPFKEIANMETEFLGNEFEFDAEVEDQFNVFLELEQGQYVDSIFVEEEITRVIVKDQDDDTDVYLFQLNYYGMGEVNYDVYETDGIVTINDLTLIFIYEFESTGSYGILPESGHALQTDFSVNQLDVAGLFGAIFGGFAIAAMGGIVSTVILVVIFVKRNNHRKRVLSTQQQVQVLDNPFND